MQRHIFIALVDKGLRFNDLSQYRYTTLTDTKWTLNGQRTCKQHTGVTTERNRICIPIDI